MTISDADGFGVGVYGDIGSINDGNWHHLVHVVDRSLGAVTYLDGMRARDTIQQGRSAAEARNIDTGAPANIGQDPTGQYTEPGSADIDDLGVWHRALSPLEAASIYMSKLSFVGAPIILTEQRLTNQCSICGATVSGDVSICPECDRAFESTPGIPTASDVAPLDLTQY